MHMLGEPKTMQTEPAYGDVVAEVRGDPDHPVSRGYTCPKGRAAGEVHHHPRQGLVQGHMGLPEPGDAAPIPEGLTQGFAQTEPHILHQVVAVHRQVAPGRDLQPKAAVAGQLRQHVVEEGEARLQRAGPAVEVQLQAHLGFRGGPFDP